MEKLRIFFVSQVSVSEVLNLILKKVQIYSSSTVFCICNAIHLTDISTNTILILNKLHVFHYFNFKKLHNSVSA